MGKRLIKTGAALTGVAAALTFTAPAFAVPHTTAERTILDCDGDDLLEFAPGEQHVQYDAAQDRDDECTPERAGRPLRLPATKSILNFLQLTDFQMVDEESPARVEFIDPTQRIPGAQPFSAAYRPQESLTTQITEAMVRQVRNTTSPVTGARPDLTIVTGDNADSQQYNETRWFIDILDGTTGAENPDPEAEQPPDDNSDRKIDPNSGVPTPNCPGTPGSVYDGVRDNGESGAPDLGFYEPDGSTAPNDDGDGYSPIRAENQAEAGVPVTVRDFPDLFEAANRPFEAVGIGMPWYSAFGNHDALVQGNSPEAYFGPGGAFPTGSEEFDPAMNAVATGCVKVREAAPGTADADALGSLIDACEDADCSDADPTFAGAVDIVPPDPRRCHLAKDGPQGTVNAPGPCETGSWIEQHFRTSGTPVGHGFAPGTDPTGYGRPPQAIANHDGYYSFSPRPGFRFIVLDTVSDECGAPVCSEGSVDDAQFDWLEQQILAAEEEGDYVVVFSHHTLKTTRQPFAVPDATEQPLHYGQRVDRDNPLNPQNPTGERTLEELYCDHPSVIAAVAGHEHGNYVRHHRCQEEEAFQTPGPGDFWHVSTAAHIDWPQQARMIELVDIDGQMSMVLTMLDHDGPAFPGSPGPGELTQGQAGEMPLRLASIGRELGYNDYQNSRGARGNRNDRNVILPLHRPPPR